MQVQSRWRGGCNQVRGFPVNVTKTERIKGVERVCKGLRLGQEGGKHTWEVRESGKELAPMDWPSWRGGRTLQVRVMERARWEDKKEIKCISSLKGFPSTLTVQNVQGGAIRSSRPRRGKKIDRVIVWCLQQHRHQLTPTA